MLSAFFSFWTVFYSIWLQVDADPLSVTVLLFKLRQYFCKRTGASSVNTEIPWITKDIPLGLDLQQL